jgi:hypothetical protein
MCVKSSTLRHADRAYGGPWTITGQARLHTVSGHNLVSKMTTLVLVQTCKRTIAGKASRYDIPWPTTEDAPLEDFLRLSLLEFRGGQTDIYIRCIVDPDIDPLRYLRDSLSEMDRFEAAYKRLQAHLTVAASDEHELELAESAYSSESVSKRKFSFDIPTDEDARPAGGRCSGVNCVCAKLGWHVD